MDPTRALHPCSAAAHRSAAEAHERIASVLWRRNPAAARAHAETAAGLRAALVAAVA